MMNLSAKILRFLKDESGPTAVEYAVMLALLIVAMFATIATLGKTSNSSFENTSTKLQAAANSGS
jgi:pilus assembly protein Flp/PilA